MNELEMSPEWQTATLGSLIDTLGKCAQGHEVVFDFCGTVPRELISYRGFYDHLAVTWKPRVNSDDDMTVADFLAMLKGAVGQTFEGYKGGEYVMSRETPVWVDNYGDCTRTAIIDIPANDFEVIISTTRRDI